MSDPLKPSIRYTQLNIEDTDHDFQFRAGDTLEVEPSFINYLHPSTHLVLQVSIPNSGKEFAELLSGGQVFGAVDMMETFEIGAPIRIKLLPNLPEDIIVPLKLQYLDTATHYRDFEIIEVRINRSWINVTENKLHSTINSRGNFGFNDFPFNREGLGSQLNNGLNSLAEGGFLIGNSPSQVSDRVRNPNIFNPNATVFVDNDFKSRELVRRVENSQLADFEAYTKFDDSFALSPWA